LQLSSELEECLVEEEEQEEIEGENSGEESEDDKDEPDEDDLESIQSEPLYDGFNDFSPENDYAPLPVSSVVNYNRLFSHLGRRETSQGYDDADSQEQDLEGEDTHNFNLSFKSISNAIRQQKYFTAGDVMMNPVLPIGGMTSEEYEKYKIWRLTDYVMAQLLEKTL